jgi:MFS family permease
MLGSVVPLGCLSLLFSPSCSAAVQPLYGQLCNIFGRRWLMLGATALFTLGSGICGGAINSSMLIAGRGIQGAGSGGMVMISGQL